MAPPRATTAKGKDTQGLVQICVTVVSSGVLTWLPRSGNSTIAHENAPSSSPTAGERHTVPNVANPALSRAGDSHDTRMGPTSWPLPETIARTETATAISRTEPSTRVSRDSHTATGGTSVAYMDSCRGSLLGSHTTTAAMVVSATVRGPRKAETARSLPGVRRTATASAANPPAVNSHSGRGTIRA